MASRKREGKKQKQIEGEEEVKGREILAPPFFVSGTFHTLSYLIIFKKTQPFVAAIFILILWMRKLKLREIKKLFKTMCVVNIYQSQ